MPNLSSRFTTYQRDEASGEAGLDYAMARYYASRSGRFMTPDPGHVGANVGDPQSWNAYVYAGNDSINGTDPSGLETFRVTSELECPIGGQLTAMYIGYEAWLSEADGGKSGVPFSTYDAWFNGFDCEVPDPVQVAALLGEVGGGRQTPAATPPADIVTSNVTLQRDAFCLWKAGGYGSDRREHAAWIVGGATGPSTLKWPWNATNDRATWNGPIPLGALAILHTHPGNAIRPSPGDFDNSKKDGFPRYVVTREGIWKTTNDYFKPMEVLSRNWWRPFEKEKCELDQR